MTDRFDIVPVRIEDESAVIIGVIMLAQARWAVVTAAGGERGAVESVHLGPATCNEGEMRAACLPARRADPEIRLGNAKGRVALARMLEIGQHLDAQRTERLRIEIQRSVEIGDADARMIDDVAHRFTSHLVRRLPVSGSL